jgi:hypothetical protein
MESIVQLTKRQKNKKNNNNNKQKRENMHTERCGNTRRHKYCAK